MYRRVMVVVPWFSAAIVLLLRGDVASSFSVSPVSSVSPLSSVPVTVKYNGNCIVPALRNHPSPTVSSEGGETSSGGSDVRDGVRDVKGATEEVKTSRKAGDGVLQRVTLRRYLNGLTKKETKLRDMESLSVSIQMACKTISNLVTRNSINQLPTTLSTTTTTTTTTTGKDLGEVQYDMRMNSMKRLDQVSTNVLRNALRFTGKLQTITPAKDVDDEGSATDDDIDGPIEHQPGVLIASTLDSKYVAVFDPLDGSGNADAAICTGTVFGIFETDDEDSDEDDSNDPVAGIDDVVVGGYSPPPSHAHSPSSPLTRAVLQPGRRLRAAGYCLYSSATILVFTLGEGTHGFTLDPQLNEFVLTHPDIRIPPRGNVYSCNEANSEGWSGEVTDYVRALKTGENEIGERYALRYVGSMVGDIHRTLMYGGIFFYPADRMRSRGNLQLLYKSAPMAFVIEQAGGKSTNGKKGLLDVKPKRVHERSPCFIGSPENIDEMKKYVKHDE